MSRPGPSRLAPLALVLALGLSACGGSDDADTPSDAASSSTATDPGSEEGTDAGTEAGTEEGTDAGTDAVELTVTREGDSFTPNGERVEMAIGQTLDLTITADVAGELHVHSTPEQEIAYEAGTSEHQITIDRPGVVEVESHEPDQVVLQLEVR